MLITELVEPDLLSCPADGELEMGRVCFSCRAVRFRMLNWAYNCHFCKKNVSARGVYVEWKIL